MLFQLNSKTVIPAGIAGIQSPWRAIQIHLPVFWIPAIPAGMTNTARCYELAEQSC